MLRLTPRIVFCPQVPTEIVDRNDGTYEVKFTAHKAATFCLKVCNSVSS